MKNIGYVNNLLAIDHKRKVATLSLTHIYNPQCEGCRNDLTEAKAISKKLGYSFVLDEPKRDLRNCIITINGKNATIRGF